MPKRFRKGIQVISYTPKIDYHKTKKDNYHWFSQYTLQIVYRLTKKDTHINNFSKTAHTLHCDICPSITGSCIHFFIVVKVVEVDIYHS